MRSLFHLLTSLCIACVAQPSLAQNAPATTELDGLSIGSYPYFVALDKRCPAPSAERAAALSDYRKQSIELARSVLPMLAASVKKKIISAEKFKETQAGLLDLEKNWPKPNELTKFDVLFNQASPAEIETLCQDIPKDITQRKEIHTMLMRNNEEMAGFVEKMPEPAKKVKGSSPSSKR